MTARHRHHVTDSYAQWLRAGAAAVGLAAAVSAGTAVAAAAPSDSPDPSPASATTEADGAGSSPVSPAAAQDADSGPVDAADAGADVGLPADDETTPDGGTDIVGDGGGDDADGGDDATLLADVSDDSNSRRHKTVEVPKDDDVAITAASDGLSTPEVDPADTADQPSEHVASVDSDVAAQLDSVPLALTAVKSPASGVMSVAIATQPRAVKAPAATLAGIVADVLSRLGLSSLTVDLPGPDGPIGSVVESLWLAVRDNEYKNASPSVAQPTDTSQTPAEIDAAALAELVSRPDVEVEYNPDGTVDNIHGAFTDTPVATSSDAAQVLNDLAPLLGAAGGFANSGDITVARVGTGDDAETFYRLHETVDGIPVLGSEVVLVTDSNGAVTGVYNYHDRGIENVDTTPDSQFGDERDAITAARAAYIRAQLSEPLGWLALPSALLSKYEPELVVYSLDPEAPPQLAWRVVVDPFDPVGVVFGPTAPSPGSTYVIDASGADAGTILAETSHAQYVLPDFLRDLLTDPATVTADDVLGNARTFNVQRFTVLPFDVDAFTDVTRNLQTHRFVGIGLPLNLFGLVVGGAPSIGGFWGYDPSAVSAHTNMARVFDYYKDVLGLNSYDGDGAPVNVVIQYNPFGPFAGIIWQFTNAYWDPSNSMLVFGDGGDFEAAVDVIGHEYTHAVFTNAVTQEDGGLFSGGGSPENGALNEAYADILGNLIEGKTDEGQWLVGEDSAIGAIRNMQDPASIETGLPGIVYPTNYADRYTGTEDGGGVHINSTIFSHAAYLMQSGAPSVSKAEWAELYYRSLYRLSSDADMADARDAVLDTADELNNFNGGEIGAIEDAFDAVGIN